VVDVVIQGITIRNNLQDEPRCQTQLRGINRLLGAKYFAVIAFQDIAKCIGLKCCWT
jgi:hypothetical protein